MLAQLLRKHGLGATIASHEAVLAHRHRNPRPRRRGHGVRVVPGAVRQPDAPALPAAPPAGTAARARILIGVWPMDGAILGDSSSRETLGADHYATSLRDAVASAWARPHGMATAAQSAAE